MESNVTRRDFLAGTVAAVSVAAAQDRLQAASSPARPGMKIGLYTITYLGVWYQGDAVPLKQLMPMIKKRGWEGIEFDTKRPHASPMDLDSDDRKVLRDLSGELELPISAVSPNCDLSSHVPEQREAMLCYVRECIKLARDVGSPICKVFAAWPGVVVRDGLADYHYTRELPYPFPQWENERWDIVRDSLRELAAFAEDQGVVISLQNHEPVTKNEDDVLKFIEEVDSPALKACMDHGTPATVKKTGDLLVHSHFNGEFRREAGGRLVSTHEVGYEDYVRALVASGLPGIYELGILPPGVAVWSPCRNRLRGPGYGGSA